MTSSSLREFPTAPLRSFELATVTYGLTSSSFNSILSLRQYAEDNYNIVENDNRAVTERNSILNGFYIDHYWENFDFLEEPTSYTHDVDAILRCSFLANGTRTALKHLMLSPIQKTQQPKLSYVIPTLPF